MSTSTNTSVEEQTTTLESSLHISENVTPPSNQIHVIVGKNLFLIEKKNLENMGTFFKSMFEAHMTETSSENQPRATNRI
jgi:hypothetical protein